MIRKCLLQSRHRIDMGALSRFAGNVDMPHTQFFLQCPR